MEDLKSTARPWFPWQRIGPADSPYMMRWHLTPWRWWPFKWRVYLHKIMRSDAEPQLHDHPFDFIALILWGGYEEQRWTGGFHPGGVRARRHIPRRPGSLFRVRQEAHRISYLYGQPSWSLVLRGPKVREWGFFVEDEPHTGDLKKVDWWRFLGMDAKPPAAYGEPE